MIGGVAIGRNEGARLVACLRALLAQTSRVVYVDSGSTDGSVETARSMGVEVVELDLRIPFTAARARNEGAARLRAIEPGVAFVQFVDGDCELVEGFAEAALAELERDDRLAAVCGRRRERNPGASLWNRLTDLEWDTPIGPTASCGGDVLMRAAAFESVGGFDARLIAGEEPELCFRLRAAGWGVLRIDREMTLHDAALTRFSQWWTRGVRAGHAAAEGAWMHGSSPERYNVRRVVRPVLWAGVLPMAAAGLALPTWGLSLACAAGLYAAQTLRMAVRGRGRLGWRLAWLWSLFTLVGQFALLRGVLRYAVSLARGRRSALIEYKGAGPAAASVTR